MEKQIIKLPDEIIKKITEFRDSYYDIMLKLGDIDIQIFNLNELKNKILKEYDEIQNKEKILTDELIKKYGYGKINIKTGEFLIEK